ncbi:DKNYY domain-containing protein [Morganella psychrotolerans]|uniref:DKNYY family protein n=1 Tax=Morganella psychrotolerans TaxID=368603 RepID=A0A1B8GZ22_9GAMM|nr:DKNYY domain-containing protein [Morganella psychrotolerans]OBU02075.1 hypothetical protein AYY17_13760 [Morganella psychrotolerans]
MKKNNVAGLIVGGCVLLTLLILLSGFILSMNKVSGRDIDNGQQIGHSIFTLYNGNIYAGVPSDGQYVIEAADPVSFKRVSDDYKARQFAVDKHHAYCGNLIVPDFNPGAAKSIGNGYFTDDRNTIYCAPFTKQNEAMTGWKKLRETWLYGWDLGGKPQAFYYPTEVLPASVTPYQLLPETGLAGNGTSVFFNGKLMPDADPQTLTAIDVQQSDLSVRKSHVFYRDNRNVYYQHNKLPLKSNAVLYGFYIGNLFREAYLFDPQSGLVATNNIVFPPEFAPYKVISRYGGHVNHVLFLSAKGVYFYDGKKEKIIRAGDNPFLDNSCQEMAPMVFSCNNQTYYLQGSESWGSNKSPGLISRSTHICLFEDNSSKEWEKTGDVMNHRYGEVWKKGNKYYYFDKLGVTQLVRHTIYEITDKQTLNSLLNDNLRPENIRQMVRNGHLQPVACTSVLQAKTRYKKTFMSSLNFFNDD